MEADIIYAKMESLTRCLQRLEDKTPASKDILATDCDIQDIIVVNLERAVQQSVDVGLHVLIDYNQSRVNTMAEVFLALEENKIISPELRKNLVAAVGFRNVAVHEYRSINWSIVWMILQQGLQDFRAYQKAILDLIVV